jgi:hypothetical protein
MALHHSRREYDEVHLVLSSSVSLLEKRLAVEPHGASGGQKQRSLATYPERVYFLVGCIVPPSEDLPVV